jgi:hypothetical protein
MTRKTSAPDWWSLSSWLLVLPSIALSAFVYFMLQWALPQEDDFGMGCVFGCLLLPTMVATLYLQGRSRRFLVPLWVFTGTSFLCATIQMFSLLIGLVVLVPAFVTFLFLLRARPESPLRRSFVAACVPPFVVCAMFLLPLDHNKQLWPWTTLQPPLQQFRRQANAAAARLGLPRDRSLSVDERARLAKEAPVTLELSFPILPLPVTARIYDLSETDVMLYWGDAQFGPLDVNSMWIRWASD